MYRVLRVLRTSIVPMPCLSMRLKRVDEVVDLRLDHEDHRGVAEARVRADQEEHVGEVRDRRALVALLAALVEDVGERAAVLAEDALERGGVGDVEAGGDDDGVDLALGAVLR